MTTKRWVPSQATMIGHVLPSIASAFLVTRWTRQGHHIAAGDVAPFIRTSTSSEMTSLWNHQVTGAGSTSVEIVRLIEVAFIQGTSALGGSNELAQAVFYAACVALAALGCSRFVATFVKNSWIVALGGLLGVVNPFVLVQLPNPLFLVAIGAIGLLIAELAGPARGGPVSMVRLVLATAPMAYLALNPALLAVAVASVLASIVFLHRYAGAAFVQKLTPFWLRAFGWSLGFHMWWLVPVVYVNLLGAEGASFGAETNVEAWSWSHTQNSVANVLTLTAHWGWPIDAIFPWASGLDGFYGQIARWALPLGALAAPVLATGKRKRLAMAMTGSVLTLVFVAKGLHGPFGSVNLFLYEHVPGSWLLREPASKVGPVLVLLLVALFTISLDEASTRWTEQPRLRFVAAAFVLGALTFPWPLISGSVIPDDRGELQSMHVAIPDGWLEAAESINASERDGKVLMLPGNDFYQVTTSWGYHGADAVPLQLLERPVIQRYPGGYFDLQPGFSAILSRVENELVDGSPAEARRLMQALGVSHVVHRHDVRPGPMAATYASDVEVAAGLTAIDGLELVTSNSMADVYELTVVDGLFEIDRTLVASAGDHDDLAQIVGGLEADEVLVDDPGAADSLVWRSDAIDDWFDFTLEQPGIYRVQALPGPRTVYLSATQRAGQWDVVLEDRSLLSLDGELLPSAEPSVLPLDNEPLAIRHDGDLLLFRQDLALAVQPGDEVEWLSGRNGGQATEFGSAVGDCNRSDDRSLDDVGISIEQAGSVVSLAAAEHAACVFAELGSAQGPVVVELDYRAITGDGGRLCIYDETDRRCLVDQRLEESDEWSTVRAVADLAPGHRHQVFVYAVGDGTTVSQVDYRNSRFIELETTETGLGDESGTEVQLTAGPHTLRVEQPTPATLRDGFSEVNDCHRVDDLTVSEAGLSVTVEGSVVRLAADVHSACTNAELSLEADRQYELSFDHRTLNGQSARFCLWLEDLGRCVEAPPLERAADWQSYRTEFEIDDDAGPVRLFLYADANDLTARTIVEFRDVAVHPSPERFVRIDRLDAPDRVPPELVVSAEGPGAFAIEITGADGPFALTMAESFAAGWHLNGLPDGWSARSLESNAYGNVWLIEGFDDAVLNVNYRPNRIATLGQLVSLITLGATLLLALRRSRLETELEKDRADPDRLLNELVPSLATSTTKRPTRRRRRVLQR